MITIAAAVATRVPLRGSARAGGQGSVVPTSNPRPPASEDALALLDGLKPGDSLAGYQVRGVLGPVDRHLAIEVAGREIAVTLSIARIGVDSHRAPKNTERYSVFYEKPHGAGGDVGWDEVEPLLAAIAERIARTEHRVPVPAGM